MAIEHDINGLYTLPHDAAEADRLTKQHFVWKALTGGSNFIATLPENKDALSILDCGTGTGIWALDALKEARSLGYQNIDVVGVDMTDEKFPAEEVIRSSINSEDGHNDSLELMTYNIIRPPPACLRNRFDLINIRLVFIWNHSKDWPQIIANLYACLKPGGYLQDTETALYLNPSDRDGRLRHTTLAIRYCIAHLHHTGNDGPRLEAWYRAKGSLPPLLRERGWRNVQMKTYDMPSGHFADPTQNALGLFTRDNMLMVTRLGAKVACHGKGFNSPLQDEDVEDDTLNQPYVSIPKDSDEVERLALLMKEELDARGAISQITVTVGQRPQ